MRAVEHADRDADRARDAADRALEQLRIAEEVEETRRRAALEMAEAQHRAEAARAAAEQAQADMRARLAASLPPFALQAIDEEVFFSSLPAPSLVAYARLFKRLTSGPDAVQSLAADGVSLEMIAVINQTWGGLFAQRPELAMRFSVLFSSSLG